MKRSQGTTHQALTSMRRSPVLCPSSYQGAFKYFVVHRQAREGYDPFLARLAVRFTLGCGLVSYKVTLHMPIQQQQRVLQAHRLDAIPRSQHQREGIERLPQGYTLP